MFPGLAAAAAAHRCSWAALCRLGGGRAATRGRSQGE
uniref:Solute carrier family 30 (zinc transporter), member 9 n=1 Tax=Mus musculus TaxID=10090 RepID=A0A0J9YU90_MOUSE